MTSPSSHLAVEHQPPSTQATLQKLLHGYKSFQILYSAYTSHLFDWLATRTHPVSKADIVAAQGLRGAHAGAWLQSLVELGCLLQDENGFSLDPGWRKLLVSSSPWFMGTTLDELATPGGRWSELNRFMHENQHQTLRAPGMGSPLAAHPQHADALTLARHLQHIAPASRSLLCFDASAGLLAAHLCRLLPLEHITLVVPETQHDDAISLLQEFGLESRCQLHTGTPLTFAQEDHYELVLLFHSLYAVRKVTNDALAAASARLASGGLLAAAHWFCLEACEPAPGGIEQMDRAVITDYHPMCHVETFCDRLLNLGLHAADKQDLPGEYGTLKLHLARKP
ncbi:MAG: hypothetical protein ABN482_06415 [Corticimicrobacter sp.]|uniref:hypothetical protein n=1 Tax=Corticimicrobacter sp. TaxID=2678536 RepID=UPI0032DAD21D